MILIIAENTGKKIKKATFEAITYGRRVATVNNDEVAVLILGSAENADSVLEYGPDHVFHVNKSELDTLDSQVYAKVISDFAKEKGANLLIVNHSHMGKSIAGRMAVRLNAGIVSGVNSVPQDGGDFRITKPVFSGKALATYDITSDVKIITLASNAIQPEKTESKANVQSIDISIPAAKIKVIDTKVQSGITPLPEAEKVVSGGRGFKGPENWGILEELADALNATTACSRPVADADWRPHHEHVGQTGVAIRPNLYIAIGISGAIQHLAGVNNSKCIVVINKDTEAPFFKAADYGVHGDLFDVVPKLTAAVKKFNESNS